MTFLDADRELIAYMGMMMVGESNSNITARTEMATWVDKLKYLHMHKQYRFPIGSLAVKEPGSMNMQT